MDKVKLEACPEECWHDATEKPDHGEAVIAEYHEYDDPARPAMEHVVWWWEDQWRTYPNVDDLAYVNRWRRIPSARPTPEPSGEVIQAAQAVIATADDYYTARNGRRCSIEGSDGEKCWIVPFDQFEDLRNALRLTQGDALTDEGRSMAGVIDNMARQAMRDVEVARTDVVRPVNGSAPYTVVIFHGQRVEFHDDEWTIEQKRDAGSSKAAAYAQSINDGLFALAKSAVLAALTSTEGEG